MVNDPLPHDPRAWRQLLAAYADGELEGEDRQALRQQVECWLTASPQAVAEWLALQRLQTLYQETTPTEPDTDTWEQLWGRVQQRWQQAERVARRRRRLALTALTVLLTGALLGWLAWPARSPPGAGISAPVPTLAGEETPFPVARAEDVDILRIAGEDLETLAVDTVSLPGSIVLAGPGDVTIRQIQPAPPDNMLPAVLDGGAPMIWAWAAGERPE
jgi:hypothetical protein